jgi:thioesterase domain-containing protein
MAVQLRAAGEEVPALIILDTYPPRQPGAEPAGEDGEYGPAGPDPMLAPDPDAELQMLKGRVQLVADLVGGLSDEECLQFARLAQNNAKIAAEHPYGWFDGDALILVAQEREDSPEAASDAREWEPYVSGTISEVPIPTSHKHMVDPEYLGEVWSAIAGWMETKEG